MNAAADDDDDDMGFCGLLLDAWLDVHVYDAMMHLCCCMTQCQSCQVLRLDECSQKWVFTDIDAAPVPSLLRGFRYNCIMLLTHF